MKKVFRYLLTCLIVAVIVAPFINPDLFSDLDYFWLTIQFSLICTTSGLYGTIWLSRYLDKKYNWINNLWKRLVLGIVVLEAWSVIIYTITMPILLYIYFDVSGDETIYQLLRNVKYPLLTGIAGMLILSVIEFFKNWKQSYLKQQKLKAEMQTYKYEALRSQLNPHFLFNSLNVLSSLVYEDPTLAEKFIDQLSDLYAKVLDSKDKELIPLAEELDFINAYIFLLKTRFENKLDIQVNILAGENEYVAPMVLQLLIENAVKHNIGSKDSPLKVWIEKTGSHIETRNTLLVKKTGDRSTGMGLQNIMQRYRFFTNQLIEVNQSEKEFSVKIPILNQAV